jgi:predicted nucleic acid-binding protein
MPAWFEVRTVQETETTTFPVTLHRGERQAILLAEALPADVLLIDEQIGRTIALSGNLPLSGTLGVLERADRMGFVSDFPRVLQRLKASGFFVTQALEQQLLERHRTRSKPR